MGAKAARHTLPDTYFALVREFPLTHIRDAVHLEGAAAMLDRLLREDRDAGAEAYLDVLTDLVEAYEDDHVPIPDASAADVLRELMAANGLSQHTLAREVGIVQLTISAVLSGGRSLTRDHMIKLGRRFHVPPSVFLPG